jgi:hypothetical protein
MHGVAEPLLHQVERDAGGDRRHPIPTHLRIIATPFDLSHGVLAQRVRAMLSFSSGSSGGQCAGRATPFGSLVFASPWVFVS